MKTPWSRKRYRIVLIVLTGALLATGLSWYGWHKLSAPQQPMPHPMPQVNLEGATLEDLEPKPEPIMIALPGAAPFVAPLEDHQSDASIWRLVNKTRPFDQLDYTPSITLVTVPTQPGRGVHERSTRAEVTEPLQALFNAANSAGFSLQVGSGYRSYATQVSVFGRYVSQVGEAQARTFSAPPGHSEHQSGLAVDISTADQACWLEICFGELPAGQWLAANAHKYGFTVRYPEGKESITGFQYEPWHFRYLGEPLAQALYQSGLTLEGAQPYLNQAREALMAREG